MPPPFSTVLGQDHARAVMASALAQDRIGHAYLFTGPDGTGKTLFAMEMAKALLCRSEGAPHGDDCTECRTVGDTNHPDLSLVAALEGKRGISIEQARDLSHTLSLKPVQSPWRVAILREADRLGIEAANSLLKTLEEPPPYAVLILTTALPRNLPDTIRSRCQELRFGPLEADHIRSILAARTEFAPDEAALAAQLSQGSAGRAIQTLETGCMAMYLSLADRVLALPEEDPFSLSAEVAAWLKEVSSTLEPRRERLREILRLLTCAYRDVLLLEQGGAPDDLLHTDQSGKIHALAQRLNRPTIEAVIEAIWTTARQIRQNASLDLALEALFMRIAHLQG